MYETNNYKFEISEECALKLDSTDPLSQFRNHFYIPKDVIYMDGNSLGLLSRDSKEVLLRVLNEWKGQGIDGWLDAEQPWFHYAEKLGVMASRLVGASPDEVVATGTTTVNIHSLIGSFYRPKQKRIKILADELNFPSDIYALKGQLKLKGLNPQKNLVLAASTDGRTLNEEKITELFTSEIAVVFLPSVLYRSGQLLNMAYLTEKAHKKGILIGFDCSHSVGAVPHQLDEWGVDFALWCSYKYMNGGPGSPAFLYVNKKHFKREPYLAGWFGYIKEKQFDMRLEFEHNRSAGGWQISSPCILGAAPLEGSLKIFHKAGIKRIREKSIKMTSYLIYLVDNVLSAHPYRFKIGTPRDPNKRGGHVALEKGIHAWTICQALKSGGIIPDFRHPNIIRIAPVALYNTFHEVWKVVQHIKDIIDTGEYKSFSNQRRKIT